MFGQIKTVIKKREAEKDRKNRNVKLNLIISFECSMINKCAK